MSSLRSEFEFRNRGFKDTLILVPGWAADWRIFDGLELDYNYLLATKLNTADFIRQLLSWMDQSKTNKVFIFGVSLGGFLAVEFASEHSERIAGLILLGVRKSYDPQLLENVKREILADPRPWLYKFYLNCFSKEDRKSLVWFRKNLLNEYLDNLNTDELIAGLDYLANHTIYPGSLGKIEDIRIFHGSDDIIAPVNEILEVKAELPQARFTLLEHKGHLFSLSRDFRERFYHG